MRVLLVLNDKHCDDCHKNWIYLGERGVLSLSEYVCSKHIDDVKYICCQSMLGTLLESTW